MLDEGSLTSKSVDMIETGVGSKWSDLGPFNHISISYHTMVGKYKGKLSTSQSSSKIKCASLVAQTVKNPPTMWEAWV